MQELLLKGVRTGSERYGGWGVGGKDPPDSTQLIHYCHANVLELLKTSNRFICKFFIVSCHLFLTIKQYIIALTTCSKGLHNSNVL